MSDETFLYWGMIVTVFLVIAGLLTVRELVEARLEDAASAKNSGRDD